MADLEFTDGEGAALDQQQPEVGAPSPERESLESEPLPPATDEELDDTLAAWRREHEAELRPAVREQVFGWFGVSDG